MTIKLALTIPEAAEACGVGRDTIRRAIKDGALKAKFQSRNKEGKGVGKHLVTVKALEAYVDGLPDA